MSLSPAAAAKFHEMFRAANRTDESATIRLYVAGRGCCRATYGLSYADGPGREDTVIQAGGIRLVVDRQSRELCDGVSIDYLQTPSGEEGFAVRGPRLAAGCGCGHE